MCTAISLNTKAHYFGRNLDLEYSYDETVTITPRNYKFTFQKAGEMAVHYAMIGVAYVVDDYPLYYDATNEKGLSMAGLNFPGNAFYQLEKEGADNISTFEFIPWILGQCATVPQAKELLARVNLIRTSFKEDFPVASLHWMITDRDSSITVEPMEEGLRVYDNPVGVLTNNPPFEYQMFQLNNYMSLTSKEPENHFSRELSLECYCQGMGAMGLPGDLSSMSRFVRAAFVKLNSVSGESEEESISQFFHILGAVEQQRGCVCTRNGAYDITVYSSCCNTDKGIYYYTTYENRQITGVDMHKENLEGSGLVSYPLIEQQQVYMQN